MKSHFLDLFNYNHFMNEAVLSSCVNGGDKITDRCADLLSHIMNANHIWNCRIEGKVPEYGVWESRALSELGSMEKNNFEISCIIVDNVPFDKMITYINSKGQQFTNPVQEILFHVINHSTYHRAQIASELKNCGIQPPITDYIFYKR